jgi:hypothetical protein
MRSNTGNAAIRNAIKQKEIWNPINQNPEWDQTTTQLRRKAGATLKKNYERLKQEVQEAEENTKDTYEKKKALGLERKEAKSEKAEAEKYQKLRDNLAHRQMELQ